ncbi:MAG: LamG domain-containing protein [bacterium]
MKRIPCYMLVLSTMLLVGTGWAGLDKTSDAPQKLTLALDLDDGSRVIGTPSIESIPVQTSYAKMDITLNEILTIRIEEDHEKSSIDLRNGDKLKGVINLEPIKLETIFGKVKIGVEHVRELCVVLSGGALPDALRKGLVLYYSFDRDEGGSVTDKSDKRNEGKVQGAKWTPKGKQGGAYEFNGRGDYIDTLQNFSGMNEITVCGWSFFTSPPADSSVITQYGDSGPENVWALFSGANGKCAQVNFCPESKGDYYFFGNPYELNRWKHLCVTYAAGKALTLYEDGIRVNSVTVPDLPLRKTARYTAKVGASQGGSGYFGSGLIDEVMIYDHALSDSEVKQVYDIQK